MGYGMKYKKGKGFPFKTEEPEGPVAPEHMLHAKEKEPKEEIYKVPTDHPGAEGFDTRRIDPGFEDPLKVQELQRKGITPDSQKFGK